MKARMRMERRGRAGLSLVELMVLVGVMALVALIFLPAITHRHRPAYRMKCINNLKNVGLAFRIFATDNNDLFPAQVMATNGWHNADALTVYRWLSNELSTPILVYCPKDAKREQAQTGVNFATMSAKNASYFVSMTAREGNYATFLAGDRNLMTNGKAVGPGMFGLMTNSGLGFTKEIHEEQGNICMADGSVQQFANANGRMQQAVRDQGVGTNWLAVP